MNIIRVCEEILRLSGSRIEGACDNQELDKVFLFGTNSHRSEGYFTATQ